MMGEEKKKSVLSDDEYFILDALRYVGAKGDDAVGPILLLNQDKKNKVEKTKKLRKYIEFKGKYITQQDILAKSFQITTPREQYYPCEVYVKYLGPTTTNLTNNKIYHLEMVFGDDEFYLIKCDNNRLREFESKWFEIQKVVEVIYIGSQNDEGTSRISEGFVIGEKYEVVSFATGKYTNANGAECWLDEVKPTKFQKKELVLPNPFENIDDALKMVVRALEFGEIRNLSEHLHPKCEYISNSGEKEFYNKNAIVKHLQYVSKTQLEKDVFIDCALATITESQETNKFPVGVRCIVIFEENGCKDIVFITISEDKRYIMGIYILNEYYKFKLDED